MPFSECNKDAGKNSIYTELGVENRIIGGDINKSQKKPQQFCISPRSNYYPDFSVIISLLFFRIVLNIYIVLKRILLCFKKLSSKHKLSYVRKGTIST